MRHVMEQPQSTVIFWGAGATAELGIRTTAQQERFIRCITGAYTDKLLEERITEALKPLETQRWHDALFDLITILGDQDENYDSIDFIDPNAVEAMSRNWREGANDEELRRRIISLRLIYDWPALKSVVSVCPGISTEHFKINDLFNLLDMHISPGFGFRAPIWRGNSRTRKEPKQFFDSRRLIGAKNALLMILIASFYIDYRECIASKRGRLQQYFDFMMLIGHRMQNQGLALAQQDSQLDQQSFYKGDVSFVSLNYDPIALWLQFNVHRELNESHGVPHIGSPAVPLHLFHDFGHLIPARRIRSKRPGDARWPWYPINEAAAQRLNEQSASDLRVRLTKFLFPHGCLCWRECPDCGKLSAYHGNEWGLDAHGLFPPPPLKVFDEEPIPEWIVDEERAERKKGKVDARECLHCGTLTYTQHTQAVMQSSFKPRLPSFIEEIQRELRATTMQATHIIFIGYSLPPDDVTYRAFFAARRQRGKESSERVRCTVVNWDDKYPGWYKPIELNSIQNLPDAVKAARDIFGEDNVRFYGGGIPNVFLDGDRATSAAVERLLKWS